MLTNIKHCEKIIPKQLADFYYFVNVLDFKENDFVIINTVSDNFYNF